MPVQSLPTEETSAKADLIRISPHSRERNIGVLEENKHFFFPKGYRIEYVLMSGKKKKWREGF